MAEVNTIKKKHFYHTFTVINNLGNNVLPESTPYSLQNKQKYSVSSNISRNDEWDQGRSLDCTLLSLFNEFNRIGLAIFVLLVGLGLIGLIWSCTGVRTRWKYNYMYARQKHLITKGWRPFCMIQRKVQAQVSNRKTVKFALLTLHRNLL